MFKKEVRLLIAAFMLMALGGLMLHLRLHPPTGNPTTWVPLVAGLASLFVLPILFSHADTALWGYIVTLIIVAAGAIGMAGHSLTHWDGRPVTVPSVLLESTLADIVILFAKVPLALAIVRQHKQRGSAAENSPDAS